MSDSTTYRVIVDLSTTGDLTRSVAGVATAAERAGGSMRDLMGSVSSLGASVAGTFTGAVEKVGSLVSMVGKLSAIAGIGGVVHSVGKLNAELEQTQISLAGILNANGAVNGLDEGMSAAGGLMRQMRQDAKALPGEFEDLKNIFTNIAVPGLQAGMSPDRLRALASNIMATSAALQVPMEVAARESAMLMMGRAGAHDILGMKLAGLGGDKATQFNAMSTQGRIEFLEKELGKFSPLIDAQGKSFSGLFSTLIDDTKLFRSQVTAPLFERVKDGLTKVNAWFDNNQGLISRYADYLGEKLVTAWDVGLSKIQEWWPAITQFASNAEIKLASIWERVEPIVGKVADHMQRMLADPRTLDRIETIAKLYAAVKIGGAAAPFVSGGANVLSSVMGGAAGGGDVAGLTGAIGGLGPAAIVTAGLVTDAVAMMDAATNKNFVFHEEAARSLKDTGKQFDELKEHVWGTGSSLRELVDVFGMFELKQLDNTAWGLNKVAGAFGSLKDSVFGLIDSGAVDKLDQLLHPREKASGRKTLDMRDEIAFFGRKETNKPLMPPAAGVNVQKVDIVVSGADDPSRVARAVFDRLSDLRRYPRRGLNTPNYSTGGR